MNIFFLDKDPSVAAQSLIDAHVNKMIIESSQMLQNCYSKDRLIASDCPRTQSGTPRSFSYFNHPCSVWVRESLSNFNWLRDHADAMVKERHYRFGKGHFTECFINFCKENKPNMEDAGLTNPAMAFNGCDHFKDPSDVVSSYQKFYVVDKRYDKKGKKMNTYTKRKPPEFWEKYKFLYAD